MDKRISVHIIGGFGDVTVGRKLKFLLLDKRVSDHLGLISILDCYEQVDEIKSNPREFLEKVVRPKFKTPVTPEVLDALAEKILSGDVRYFSRGKNGEGIGEFLKEIQTEHIVDISAPNLSHLEYLRRITEETRAHITLEKPVVSSADQINQARNTIQLALSQNPSRIFMDQEHYSHYKLIKDYLVGIQDRINRLGKIKAINIKLKETEGFDSERNRNVIDKYVSGGGIWLDLGPHVMAFLSSLEAQIEEPTINAHKYKHTNALIADERFQETRMDVTLKAKSHHFLNSEAYVTISVGKAADKKEKVFSVEHERGIAQIDIGERVYTEPDPAYRVALEVQEPFLNSYLDLIDAVRGKKQPRTTIMRSLDTLESLFMIQQKAGSNVTPYDVWSQDDKI